MTGRAQTSVDFAVAMGVFFVAVTTVIAFIPGIVQPFTSAQANPLLADRLVMQLVDNQLGDPATPSVLNTTCTMYFFDVRESDPDPCPTFDDDASVSEKLGIGQTQFVNVTIQLNVTGTGSPETVCANGDYDEVGECDTGNFAPDRRMAVGEPLPERGESVTAARRKALLDDQTVYVVVRVWT